MKLDEYQTMIRLMRQFAADARNAVTLNELNMLSTAVREFDHIADKVLQPVIPNPCIITAGMLLEPYGRWSIDDVTDDDVIAWALNNLPVGIQVQVWRPAKLEDLYMVGSAGVCPIKEMADEIRAEPKEFHVRPGTRLDPYGKWCNDFTNTGLVCTWANSNLANGTHVLVYDVNDRVYKSHVVKNRLHN